jgi:hypothetical protein
VYAPGGSDPSDEENGWRRAMEDEEEDEMKFQLAGNGTNGQIYSSSCWMRIEIEIESLLPPILRGRR